MQPKKSFRGMASSIVDAGCYDPAAMAEGSAPKVKLHSEPRAVHFREENSVPCLPPT